ncbi:MAG: ribosome biogenesis GTPase Der [Candidatus Dormibacteria bacterium]
MRARDIGLDGEAGAAAPSGIVAIVGRPNVGKSTLFNRLAGRRQAIVDELAGLTRDRLYGITEWRGRAFTVVDTAGLETDVRRADSGLADLVAGTQEQARQAIAEADLCLLLLDVREGVTALDEAIAAQLRRGGKPVVLAGNKSESATNQHFAHELYRLGLGEPILISALQGKDTGDLLDRIVDRLPPAEEGSIVAEDLSLAIIGRPNVGKSSLLNAIVGADRALVSPVAGTTRDAVDTIVERDGERIRLVDTAGIRRRGLVHTNVEHYSVLRALKAIERADVGIVVVDASAGVVGRDRHIAGYASDAGKGLVVVVNKWDLVDEETRGDPAFLKAFQAAFAFTPGVPVVTASALEGRNIVRVLDTARAAARSRATRIPTPALNNLIRSAVDEHPPPHRNGRRLKILYATQAASAAPTIVLFVNDPELLQTSYGRYLENRIRAVFGFGGVRLRMVARRRSDS